MKQCAECNQPFKAKRSDAKFCGPACTKRGQRRKAIEIRPDGLLEVTDVGLGDIFSGKADEQLDRLQEKLKSLPKKDESKMGPIKAPTGATPNCGHGFALNRPGKCIAKGCPNSLYKGTTK